MPLNDRRTRIRSRSAERWSDWPDHDRPSSRRSCQTDYPRRTTLGSLTAPSCACSAMIALPYRARCLSGTRALAADGGLIISDPLVAEMDVGELGMGVFDVKQRDL